MTSATSQAFSTAPFDPTPSTAMIEIDPCSNDNPEWDAATQPCPNSITDYIFDGAITTRPPAATTTAAIDEEIFSTSSVAKDLPTSYSCETTVADTQNTPSAENQQQQQQDDREAMYLKFNYEIYTILNQTQQERMIMMMRYLHWIRWQQLMGTLRWMMTPQPSHSARTR